MDTVGTHFKSPRRPEALSHAVLEATTATRFSEHISDFGGVSCSTPGCSSSTRAAGRGWIEPALWLAFLITTVLLVWIKQPTGWLGSDDAFYFSAAEQLLEGSPFERVHHHYARMVVIVPIAAALGLFGSTPAVAVIPTTLAAALCLVMVAQLGRQLWGWEEGLLAATVVGCIPYFGAIATTAYPDAHLCLWTTLAASLAVAGQRDSWRRRRWLVGIMAGFIVGLGVSAKIFALLALIPVVGWGWAQKGMNQRTSWCAAVGAGLALYLFCEGGFYRLVAGDFWFTYHAHVKAQVDHRYFPEHGYYQAATWLELAWNRLTMPLYPRRSGWGWMSMAFLPATVIALWNGPRVRTVALWALVAYFIIALMPVNPSRGWHPYPDFDGRQTILTTIPFALCLACVVVRASRRLGISSILRRAWPLVALISVVGTPVAHGAPRGFKSRPTQRIGLSVSRIVESGVLDGDRQAVVMTPSMYLRYHALFPPRHRSRLRIASSEAADWWVQTGPDVRRRRLTSLPIEGAWVVATPNQLKGPGEFWDYGAGFPDWITSPWPSGEVMETAWFQRTDLVKVEDSGARDQDEEVRLIKLAGLHEGTGNPNAQGPASSDGTRFAEHRGSPNHDDGGALRATSTSDLVEDQSWTFSIENRSGHSR